MFDDLSNHTKKILLVVISLALSYGLAFLAFMISWMNFWLRGAYFISYQAIFLVTLTILLLLWLEQHHHDNGPLPVFSTIVYSVVAGYVAGLIGMTLYPIFQPDGLQLIAMLLQFPTLESIVAFFWFPIRMLSWLFGGITGIVMILLSRWFKRLLIEHTQE